MDSSIVSDYKISIDLVRQLLQYGRERGWPVDQLIAQAGIEVVPLPHQPAFVSGPLVEQMLGIGLSKLPGPLPGLDASTWRISELFGLTKQVVQTSSKVKSALESLMRVEPLLGDVGRTQLHFEPGEAHLIWTCRFTDHYVRHHVEDGIFALFATHLFVIAGSREGHLKAVHFCHASPADPDLIRCYVDTFSCPVYFNQPENRMVAVNTVLDLPLHSADPQLHEVLDQHARKIMTERDRSVSLTDMARSQLHHLLHCNEASRERLADVLGMSSRTLHRKLQEEGSSYRGILDDLRLEKARTLLRDETLTIQQVAGQSGFDESHSFARWFKQQTGISPSEFRQGLR